MDWFSTWVRSASSAADSVIDGLKSLVNPIVAAGAGAVDNLKSKAREWYKNYQELLKIPDSALPPDLLKEKRNLASRGASIMSKIDFLGMTADDLRGGIGALPLLVPVAVIVTAASLMLYWTYDFVEFQDKLTEYRAARASGATPAQASSFARSMQSDGFLSGATNVVKYASIAGGLFFAYKIAKSQRWI